jgi:hypothetical protein
LNQTLLRLQGQEGVEEGELLVFPPLGRWRPSFYITSQSGIYYERTACTSSSLLCCLQRQYILLGAWESNPNQNITNRHLRSEAPFKIADYFASNDTKTLAKMTDKSIYTTVMAQTFSSCGNYLLAANTYGEIAVFK